jgi:tRNA pseudouridine38-40 synthase
VRNLRLLVQYAGTRYAGWQVQPGQATIQGLLQGVMQRIVGHPVKILGASRTDAGVHARGQVASVRTESELPVGRLRRSLNALLPPDIRVLDLAEAAADFHALGRAVRREYRYEIVNGEVLSPFRHGFAYHVRAPLDRSRLGEAAARILGEHDFAGFADSDRGPARTLRRVEVSEWREQEDLLAYRVVADGFVKGMVRALVGTFLDVGRGRRPPAWVDTVLEKRERALAGPSVPACGLYLQRVDYA